MRLGRASGPTAWDGYAAGAVTEARLHALASGERVAVTLMAAPGAPAHPGS
jgi:myo-inositol 2-dehydrogenase/D-chiro-inositol 1-dehydrogenase